jgi:hypothetical protein
MRSKIFYVFVVGCSRNGNIKDGFWCIAEIE